MNRIKAAFFVFTAPFPPDDDGSYLRWHLLDHEPEQYRIPGIQLSRRYIADGAYAANRIVGEGDLADVGNLMHYLVGEPVQQAHDEFMELGGRLEEMGRMPQRRPYLQLRMPALQTWDAAPQAAVSAEVVPWRPHHGALVIVEARAGDDADAIAWQTWLRTEHVPEVLATPGVAGVWRYGDSSTWRLVARARGDVRQDTTVVYLDDDPLVTTQRLLPLVERRWASGAVRPVFAGPMRTMVEWEAWT